MDKAELGYAVVAKLREGLHALDGQSYAWLARTISGAVGSFRSLDGEREDAVSAVLLRVAANIGAYNESNPKAWVGTVAKNYCIDLLRKKVKWPHDQLDDASGELYCASDPDALEALLGSSRYDCLQRGLEDLRRANPKKANALHLVYYGEMSGDEAAACMGIEPGAFRTMLCRAKRELRDIVESYS